MRKLVSLFLIALVLINTSMVTYAIPEESYLCTVYPSDLSGERYELYFMHCTGHYKDNSVTVYVTNTSKEPILFQVSIGWSGTKGDMSTCIDSGYVELQPNVTGKFVIDNLSSYPEKEGNLKLGEHSVVRVMAKNIKADDTFIVCGFSRYRYAKDTAFSDLEANAIMERLTNYGYIDSARLVIKKEVEEEKEDKPQGYTLQQPDTETVNMFIIFVVSSAIVCVGGIVIYTYTFIIKRREKND